MKKFKEYRIFLLIVVVSLSMHFPHFSKDLISIHVWRQTQTQSTINNFYEEDMNILNPKRNNRGNGDGIFRMEFPLMQWLIATLYFVFGKSVILTRIFVFIVGLFTLLGFHRLLKHLFNNLLLANIGAWAFTFSPSFYYYTINPLPDNLALCLSVWGLSFFYKWFNDSNTNNLIFSGLFLSLGTLCKLPFVLFFIVPFISFFLKFRSESIGNVGFKKPFLVFLWLLFPFAWYAFVIPKWNNLIVLGIIGNKDSLLLLLDYLQFNLISTFPELVINYASLLFFIFGGVLAFRKKVYRKTKFLPLLWLGILLVVFLLFELNAIARVHDYYLFPFFPLIFISVAYGANFMLKSENTYLKYLAIIALIILPFTCHIRMKNRWNLETPGFSKDLLTYQAELRQAVPKNALVVAGNDISAYIMLYYIDKKGWNFSDNHLSVAQLENMIKKGAQYLYTDSEKIINSQEFQQYFKTKIEQFGSISIYELQEKK